MKFNAHLASGIILPFSNKIPAATQGPFIFLKVQSILLQLLLFDIFKLYDASSPVLLKLTGNCLILPRQYIEKVSKK
jgi:hypothetical protein